MSPQERREAIISATVPLLREHGANVTTSQIAKAAGIAEGTVFRVFADKQELLDACIHSVFRVEPVLGKLAAIPRDISVRDRLVAAAEALSDHMSRLGALMHALGSSGYQPRHQSAGAAEHRRSADRLAGAIADLLGPDRDAFRIPVERVGRMFMGVVFIDRAGSQTFGEETTTGTQELVDVLLHGVLAR
ncbi:TetR family transcriptional regulator [Longimycelium tulufanense]|uniref:TetR family transcriptional regulator n=2 Tax=Longimycelium tulufanense TaxID=907463 RepID=A0A8J3CCC0_9PSEU|nr:TetR family transcriptional regulator [Longimycelium tulufanense]